MNACRFARPAVHACACPSRRPVDLALYNPPRSAPAFALPFSTSPPFPHKIIDTFPLIVAPLQKKHYLCPRKPESTAMAQSLCKIYLHIIFHVKASGPKIDATHLERVHSYIGQLINSTGCQVMCVGGVSDHIHALCLLSKNETVAHLVEEIKRNSSRWMKTLSPDYHHFAWQGGYAVFSVSQSVLEKTLNYVRNQKEHHKKVSFHDEYIQFLKLYNIEFNEQYVFQD